MKAPEIHSRHMHSYLCLTARNYVSYADGVLQDEIRKEATDHLAYVVKNIREEIDRMRSVIDALEAVEWLITDELLK